MIAEIVNDSMQSLLNTGVVGAVAVLAIVALVIIMRTRDAENKAHREELNQALTKKDEKLTVLLEQGLRDSTTAINNNSEVLRQCTLALKELEQNCSAIRGNK
jgi:hypothetical protein